ncbi:MULTISPECIES: hypothetical protein [Pandoraea]|jgi:hypothetical protein|uniref:Uncharacterized protein n=2 Tax=Pandoraea TaxID=93217 RepID=A0A5E5PC95_9BURK|nr:MULTISPECIES: hypothetical protein [Pandoraea]MBN9094662.1 hypothetical protein [Pandoraea pnomenusa]RRJ28844.1 hypothetical protein EIB05_17960 [Pandoraea apista]RRJ73772.1 hypothetical protein EIL82_18990 [Pandoraea apista]RSD07626.1 hypothetical protein EJB12_17640 [Pandoraea apista]RSD12448.1 hypothetical protein EIZ52_20170 [Pandoraea apista]
MTEGEIESIKKLPAASVPTRSLDKNLGMSVPRLYRSNTPNYLVEFWRATTVDAGAIMAC